MRSPWRFRSVDPFQANFSFADCQRVAIHNPGNATDGLQRVSVAEEEERDENVSESAAAYFVLTELQPHHIERFRPPHCAD
jgi:hypothetical protein